MTKRTFTKEKEAILLTKKLHNNKAFEPIQDETAFSLWLNGSDLGKEKFDALFDKCDQANGKSPFTIKADDPEEINDLLDAGMFVDVIYMKDIIAVSVHFSNFPSRAAAWDEFIRQINEIGVSEDDLNLSYWIEKGYLSAAVYGEESRYWDELEESEEEIIPQIIRRLKKDYEEVRKTIR